MTNTLYQEPANSVFELEVDGIVSADTWTSGTNRYLCEFINDHPEPEPACPVCSSPDPRYSTYFDGMRWMPGLPIVHFTSEGLQDD